MSVTLGAAFYPFAEDPYPFYARVRREEPITFCQEVDSWLVTRYEDIKSILLQPDVFSSGNSLSYAVTFYPQTFEELFKGFMLVPLVFNSDGAEHARLRDPLIKAFSPARIKALEPFMRQTAHALVDALANNQQADMMDQFAYPLALAVIHKLLGMPAQNIEQNRRWIHEWFLMNTIQLDEEYQVSCARSTVALQHYLAGLIAERKAAPQDDVISILASPDVAGEEPLNETELVYMLLGLILPGHKNPANLIGTGLELLLEDPERWTMLHEHPERIPQAVEEILRFDGPIRSFGRITTREVTIGGVTLPESAPLLLIYGSGNRDETFLADADEFRVQRETNPHLAFGHGIHFCIGAALARLEGRVAFEVLSQRLPHLRLVPDQTFVHAPTVNFRGYERLEVALNQISPSLSSNETNGKKSSQEML